MIYYFIIKLNSLLFKVNSGFGTMKCISHFHRCNEYTPVMFRNSYCKESIFLSQKEARSERWLPFRGFFLVTRSHDFFSIFERKKSLLNWLLWMKVLALPLHLRLFWMYINCYIFLLMIFSVQTKHHQQCSWR